MPEFSPASLSARVTQDFDRVKVGTTDQSVVMIARHDLKRTILVQNRRTLVVAKENRSSSPTYTPCICTSRARNRTEIRDNFEPFHAVKHCRGLAEESVTSVGLAEPAGS